MPGTLPSPPGRLRRSTARWAMRMGSSRQRNWALMRRPEGVLFTDAWRYISRRVRGVGLRWARNRTCSHFESLSFSRVRPEEAEAGADDREWSRGVTEIVSTCCCSCGREWTCWVCWGRESRGGRRRGTKRDSISSSRAQGGQGKEEARLRVTPHLRPMGRTRRMAAVAELLLPIILEIWYETTSRLFEMSYSGNSNYLLLVFPFGSYLFVCKKEKIRWKIRWCSD
mmetsp:Transcript_14921/g.33165  ORF Transcript_14921/g.33165 Transcript_14921/m.33165 type:complete len:226 (+) Transcript_14921:1704-2381(+)